MSARLAIVAAAADAALAGLDGTFDWGTATTVEPGAEPGDADLVVALGNAEPGGGRAPDVRFAAEAPAPGGGDPAAVVDPRRIPTHGHHSADESAMGSRSAARLIATAGDGLWSRAPWPVRDELFDLRAPATGAAPVTGAATVTGGELLVVAADDRLDRRLIDTLADRGIPARHVAALTASDLATAAAVAFPPTPDADGAYIPGARVEAVPPQAFAALAARRPLILPRARTGFGLLPGVDHLATSSDDEVVQWADALRAEPAAFAGQVALGRVAAETQRASAVDGRLVGELTG